MGATTHFYVWYIVRGDAGAAVAAVTALLTDVEAVTGIAGRVLGRRDDPSTWMEIYEQVDDPPAFERTLASLARKHGLLEHAENGRRHVEQFAALADLLTADSVR